MEKILIKKQGNVMEMEISKSTTGKTIINGLSLYVSTVAKMSNLPIEKVIEDLKIAMTSEEAK